jgi:hypothetical protein
VDTWYRLFENPKVPVLLDDSQDFYNYFLDDLYGFPTLFLLDEDMNFSVYTPRDYTKVFDALQTYSEELGY